MDLMLIIIGLLILVAVLRNKDISENKKDDSLLTFWAIFIIILFLEGMGFIMKSPSHMTPNYSMLIFFQVGLIAVSITPNNSIKVISRVAAISIFVFLIMGFPM